MTKKLTRLQSLSAGDGRWAIGRAHRVFDCAAEPAWSPTNLVAFSRSSDGWPFGCPGGIWVTGQDGAGLRRLTDEGRNPDFSPDGSQLAYDARGAVIVSGVAGGERRVVAEGSDPSWSPDGTRLAFTRNRAVYVIGADGAGERLVATSAEQPDWSPDGRRLVFACTSGCGLGLVDSDGTERRALTAHADDEPAWSPHGDLIAFVNAAAGVLVVAPDGTGRRSVGLGSNGLDATAGEVWDESGPAWSPDSRRIVFSRWDEEFADEDDSHLFIARLEGGGFHGQLTSTPEASGEIEVGSRGGKRIASIRLDEQPVAVAVSRFVTAALVRHGSAWRIEVFAPKRRTVALASPPTSEPVSGRRRLVAAGTKLAFHAKREIFVVDARTGAVRLVAHTSSQPIGLAMTGNRLIWAENVGRGARVHALTLAPG